jgi:hypothetical protein
MASSRAAEQPAGASGQLSTAGAECTALKRSCVLGPHVCYSRKQAAMLHATNIEETTSTDRKGAAKNQTKSNSKLQTYPQTLHKSAPNFAQTLHK